MILISFLSKLETPIKDSDRGFLSLTGLNTVIFLVTLLICMGNASSPAASAQTPGTVHLQDFAPGIRINWMEKEVEVDSHVVLRQGMLELFACSPRTREHESILCIDARPTQVFQAMGLIGLESGHPPNWDSKKQRTIPPVGQKLILRVRYEQSGKTRTDDIFNWLWDDRNDRPVPRPTWLFCGSVVDANGTLAAEYEGTVVSVVDFYSSLISLSESYSSSNDELWLRPNTRKVPPENTPCTLLIRACPPESRHIDLQYPGCVFYEGKSVNYLQLLSRIRNDMQTLPGLFVTIHPDENVPDICTRTIRNLLIHNDLPPDQVEIDQENDSENQSVFGWFPRSRSLLFRSTFAVFRLVNSLYNIPLASLEIANYQIMAFHAEQQKRNRHARFTKQFGPNDNAQTHPFED